MVVYTYYGGLMVPVISGDRRLWCSTLGSMVDAAVVILSSILPLMGPMIVPYRAIREPFVHMSMWTSCHSIYGICNRHTGHGMVRHQE